MMQHFRITAACIALYAISIASIAYLLQGLQPAYSNTATVNAIANQTPNKPTQPRFVLVSGKPIRITIPGYAIDLPIDEGYYNPANGEWTLSKTHAQFAMMTTLANNASGNTFVYGHGTEAVFGKIGTSRPAVGTQAIIYTDNGHAFSYLFQDSHDMTPNDTSILTSSGGPSTLTLQTCTGAFSQWRTMFRFNFEKVIQ